MKSKGVLDMGKGGVLFRSVCQRRAGGPEGREQGEERNGGRQGKAQGKEKLKTWLKKR